MNAQSIPTTGAAVSRLEVGGVLLLMAGFGYINGNFIQPVSSGLGVFIDTMHFIPLAVMVWLGIGLLRLADEASATVTRRRGLRIGVTVLAALAVLTCLVMIALGVFAPGLGVGVQEFSDWLAVILQGGGAVLWFASLRPTRRAVAEPAAIPARIA